MDSFVHLHCRSYFSLKDGAYSPENLALRAAELGMPAVALTDRDGLYGVARFVTACRELGVKPILGAWLTASSAAPVDGVGPSPNRVLLLARDARGYANLCRLITAAHMAGERGDPHLEPFQILERAEGLACLLGPESGPGTLAAAGMADAAREAARPWREAFGSWCFVEVRNLLEPWSRTQIRRLLRLSEEAGLAAAATNSVRYLVPDDAFLADALECMREIVPVAPHHVTRSNAEGYLKPAAEMRRLFADLPDLCDASVRIAESCDVDLGLDRRHFPDFPTPRGRSAASILAKRCQDGLTRRGMERTRDVADRLDHELALIHRMGYAAYFLTVAGIVEEVKAMGIRCACRGSAAGSLVCYLTGISEVDPVRHGLLFERFINPLRDELPDIDLDVESARREEVYDAVLSRYGEDRCACVTMVDTYRARAAIREMGKALGYPDAEIDQAAKAFPHVGAHRIRQALGSLPELRGSNLGAGQLELLFRVAERLNGFPRHLALHPSGIVLSGDDLPDRVPMERSFLDHRMVQADKDDVEVLGLLKLDVLGVRMLSAMRHALGEIERTTGERVDLDSVPDDDPATFELIRSSRTIGCFQIESPGQRELLQKFQPDRFEDLIVDISLFRPGPVKSDMVTPFINRRHGLERPRYAHPLLKPVLQETYGVIVYHEQVMRVLAASGCDLAEADRIRRHLDDDVEIDDLRRDFLFRVTASGLGTEDAEKVWRELASFASFGFCKAHAAAFAVPTYQSAWLKAHFPVHFLTGVLTHEPGMYPRRLILEDARESGIGVLPLDVNRSAEAYTVESGGIRLALQDVHGISDAEIRSILEARGDRRFDSVGDFLRRANVSRPVAEALAHAGAFDALPDASTAAPVDGAVEEARSRRPELGSAMPRRRDGAPARRAERARGVDRRQQASRSRRWTRRDRLFVAMTAETAGDGEQLALPLAGEPEPAGLREYTEAERVRAELEVTGLDASRHLLSFYEPLLADLGVIRSRDLSRRRGDEWVMVAGVKVASQTPAVRSGQRIIFLTLDDATGPVDVTVFERVQDRCARTVFHSFLLAVWGRLRRTGVRGVSIIAEEVWDLAALDRARREGRLAEFMAAAASGERIPPIPRKLWHASGGSAGW
ncbi:MAG TPA: DNA polymerase III subunit alpha [Actinomycetota bacterium]|nr:DNA polymerase III subunit alpha [Actinomycetota bacterium]